MITYPEYVKIGTEKVKINTDFKIALRCIEISRDVTIGEYEKQLAIVYLLYGNIPLNDDIGTYLDMAYKFLTCNKNSEQTQEQDESEQDMDLLYDEKYINASFFSEYQIDLTKVKMHFWQYCDLIEGLGSDCILNRIRDIRTCDLSEYSPKYREKMQKARDSVALPIIQTREEREKEDEFENWLIAGGVT